jgi:DNA recombination protein RmuC
MDTSTLIILAVIIVGFGILFWALNKKKPESSTDSMLMLQRQLESLSKTVDSKLSESTKMTQEFMAKQFGTSTKIITDVTEKLTKLDETNKQVLNFSDQLRNLQDILKNPKQRGILGEYYLETLLKNAFNPTQYQMQYSFKNGDAVDAALFMGDKIIPIDSKFSLENYNRIVEEKDQTRREELEKQFKNDLKKRIDETAKYIRPAEGTTEFAFMFIPAEGIYYDLLVNQVGAIKVNTRDLIDYAIHERKVHIVSPTTFYVTLQSLATGMRAFQIQESTKDILKNIGLLGRHLKAYDDYFKKLGGHISTTVNTYNFASKEFKKIDKDVLRLTGEQMGVEADLLIRPDLD